jgi:leader peptidase (prepilin peptidase) / N-methyltransferase
MLQYTGLAAFLLTAAEMDRRWRIIPNRLVLVGLAYSLVCAALTGFPVLGHHLLTALCCGALVWLLRLIGQVLFKQPGMGMGDVKLIGVTALFLGWEALWLLYLAVMLAGIYSMAGMLLGRIRRSACLPFAPFVAVSAFLSVSVLPSSILLP